jgi:hypothetical protein
LLVPPEYQRDDHDAPGLEYLVKDAPIPDADPMVGGVPDRHGPERPRLALESEELAGYPRMVGLSNARQRAFGLGGKINAPAQRLLAR